MESKFTIAGRWAEVLAFSNPLLGKLLQLRSNIMKSASAGNVFEDLNSEVFSRPPHSGEGNSSPSRSSISIGTDGLGGATVLPFRRLKISPYADLVQYDKQREQPGIHRFNTFFNPDDAEPRATPSSYSQPGAEGRVRWTPPIEGLAQRNPFTDPPISKKCRDESEPDPAKLLQETFAKFAGAELVQAVTRWIEKYPKHHMATCLLKSTFASQLAKVTP